MEQINSKQDLINYFEKGCKKENQLSVGVEHEKFIFNRSEEHTSELQSRTNLVCRLLLEKKK